MNVVTPSKWLSEKVKNNEYTSDWPVQVIYTPINSEVFVPIDRKMIRHKYNLINKRILFF